MKIKDKLFLGFGVYILFASILGFLSYKELDSIKRRLSLVEKADDITNILLEIRRYEKNYLLYKDEESFIALKGYLEILKNDITNINQEIKRMIGQEQHKKMRYNISIYEGLFDRITQNLKKQAALIENLRKEGRTFERRLSGDELKHFLVLRRYEKNLILYEDIENYNKFIGICNLITHHEINKYCSIGTSLFELFREEKDIELKMRLIAREIQLFTEDLSRKERINIDNTVRRAKNLLIYAIIGILFFGMIVNVMLAKGISEPIRRLERITKKMAMGDMSEHLKISGNDEIASLAASFGDDAGEIKRHLAFLRVYYKNSP
jgi:HAMP domain-containing protein